MKAVPAGNLLKAPDSKGKVSTLQWVLLMLRLKTILAAWTSTTSPHSKCTECVGFHDEPQCAAVCPVDCCVDDPEHRETEEMLLAKKAFMHL